MTTAAKNRSLRVAANQIRKGSGYGGTVRQLAMGPKASVSEADKNKNQDIKRISEEILENLDGGMFGKVMKEKVDEIFKVQPYLPGGDEQGETFDAEIAALGLAPFHNHSAFDANFDLYNEKEEDSRGLVAFSFSCNSFAPRITIKDPEKNNMISVTTEVAPQTKDATTPTMCVLSAKHFDFSPTNALTSEIEVFANAIPTYELSRCVPYLDIQFFTSSPALSEDDKPFSISLAKALVGGGKNIKGESGTKELARNAAGSSALNRTAGTRHNSSFGMEMFTMPQTVVPLNHKSRAVPILDPFRPFMSITSFDVSVVPAAGLMEKKKAKLSITLHDRSRLHEIAELIRPENYGTNELLIEYGWSHPDNSHRSAYGRFLNSMRQTEKFAVVNTSFSMGNNGEVNIELDLFAKGNMHTESTSIFENKSMKSLGETMGKVTDKIRKVLAEKSKGKKRKDISAIINIDEALLSNATIFAGNLGDIGDEVKNSKELTGAVFSKPEMKELLANLKKLNDDKSKFVSKKKALIDGVIKVLFEQTADPFYPAHPETFGGPKFRKKPAMENAGSQEEISRYITIGKLFSNFVGRPLAATGKYAEVQLFFYGFSDVSGYTGDKVKNPLSQYTIDQFLVDKVEFRDALDFMIQNLRSADIPVQTFMMWMVKNFIQYPFAPMTQVVPPEALRQAITDAGRKTLPSEGDKDAAASKALDEKFQELTKNYRSPKIQIMFEALPAVPTPGGSRSAAASKTILRVHIFDNHSGRQSAYIKALQAGSDTISTLKATNKALAGVVNAAESDSAAAVQNIVKQIPNDLIENVGTGKEPEYKLKIPFTQLKRIITRGYPTLTYGSDGSVITSAKFSSIQSSGYKNVQLKRYGKDPKKTPKGTQPNGLPLQVQPADASITMLGCPIIRYAQHFFVDFGTGTSVDDLYYVKTVNHRISPGSFTTSVSLYNRNADGAFESLFGLLEKSKKLLKSSE